MFNRKSSLALIAGVSFLGFLPVAAFAQTADGSLGSTSTGQIDLDLRVNDSVEITSLNSIDLGSYGGGDTGGINSGDSFCVYVNGADDFTITPTSTNGQFALKGDTDGDEIEYTVKFANASAGADSGNAIAFNASTATFFGSQLRDCGGKDNASIDVSIKEQEIRDATTDTYQDTLILLVNPV